MFWRNPGNFQEGYWCWGYKWDWELRKEQEGGQERFLKEGNNSAEEEDFRGRREECLRIKEHYVQKENQVKKTFRDSSINNKVQNG